MLINKLDLFKLIIRQLIRLLLAFNFYTYISSSKDSKLSNSNVSHLFFPANNQSSERISTTTETRTSAITSSSVAPITAVTSPSVVTTVSSKKDKSQVEDTEIGKSEQKTQQQIKTDDQKLNQEQQEKADSESTFDSMHLMLEPHLRPVSPDPNSKLSKEIFEEHKQLANEYLKVIFIDYFNGLKLKSVCVW